LFVALLISLAWILTNVAVSVYSERKVSAFFQDRLGPMEVGPYGIFQIIADLLKLIQKEDIVPTNAVSFLFKLAPYIIFVSVFVGFSVLPFGPDTVGSSTQMGVYFLLTIISFDIFGVLLAGWSSNNKYSLFGAMRSVGQLLSYELPLGMCVLCVTLFSQNLNLSEISLQQGVFSEQKSWLLGIKSLGISSNTIGGVVCWNIVQYPILIPVFIIYFICVLAECNRAPFDLPEAESELVGGFHTEYSGMRFALVFLSEYGLMLLLSLLGAILFFGSWYSPFPNIGFFQLAHWTNGAPGTAWALLTGIFWLAIKAYLQIFLMMWIRWTLPRLRVDQLMYLSWKVLLPASFVLFVFCMFYRLLAL
jgi:NADH-quinone oxidoreductase subunit H